MGMNTSLARVNGFILSVGLLLVSVGISHQSIPSFSENFSPSSYISGTIRSALQTIDDECQDNNSQTAGAQKLYSPCISSQQELISSVNLKFRLDKIQIGLIQSFAVQSNKVFLSGNYGLAILDLAKQESFVKRFRNTPIGVDNESNMWYLIEKSGSVFRWDGLRTMEYSKENGWILPAKFFTPPLPTLHSSFLADGKNIWLATSNDVRFFNGSRWRIFTATEIGIKLPYKSGVESVFTISRNPSTGNVLVAACFWQGNQWIGGSSPLQFDGKTWQRTEFPIENICVTNMTIINDGNVLVTTPDSLWEYNGQGWVEGTPLYTNVLSNNTTFRFGPIWTDKDENQWLLGAIINPNGMVEQHILYQRKNQNLFKITSFNGLLPPQIFFTPTASVFAFTEKQLFHITPSGTVLFSEQYFDLVAQDENGSIWLISDTKTRPVLWQLVEKP